MGYVTEYNLKFFESKLSDLEKKGLVAEIKDRGFPIGYGREAKWYEHEKDMKNFSKEFPNIIFKLSGEGENQFDVWIKYFKNGKMVVNDVIVSYRMGTEFPDTEDIEMALNNEPEECKE